MTESIDKSFVKYSITDGVGRLSFGHPKANCLTRSMLSELVSGVQSLDADASVSVILLESAGGGAFCAGASFEEMEQLQAVKDAKYFFSGFGEFILALRRSRNLCLARVHGKAVGGGVGLVAAADYAFAVSAAQVQLSEARIGLGPFVIGAAVERKLGAGAFSELAIDGDWKTAAWAQTHGLYSRLVPDLNVLDKELGKLASEIAQRPQKANLALKQMLWANTPEWDKLLLERAQISAELLILGKKKSVTTKN